MIPKNRRLWRMKLLNNITRSKESKAGSKTYAWWRIQHAHEANIFCCSWCKLCAECGEKKPSILLDYKLPSFSALLDTFLLWCWCQSSTQDTRIVPSSSSFKLLMVGKGTTVGRKKQAWNILTTRSSSHHMQPGLADKEVSKKGYIDFYSLKKLSSTAKSKKYIQSHRIVILWFQITSHLYYNIKFIGSTYAYLVWLESVKGGNMD